ncbi:hypothetical protein C8034_v006868 [Colletotrichum sidae]|uniref:Uncharacterized protein n=1 Tax=Colletotrichum sidae TaxID=1347389 RepID=A0A4R8T972_9PEZI|nr:hypothetical protein C8034_v006868 [Colletotrichum sidae]
MIESLRRNGEASAVLLQQAQQQVAKLEAERNMLQTSLAEAESAKITLNEEIDSKSSDLKEDARRRRRVEDRLDRAEDKISRMLEAEITLVQQEKAACSELERERAAKEKLETEMARLQDKLDAGKEVIEAKKAVDQALDSERAENHSLKIEVASLQAKANAVEEAIKSMFEDGRQRDQEKHEELLAAVSAAPAPSPAASRKRVRTQSPTQDAPDDAEPNYVDVALNRAIRCFGRFRIVPSELDEKPFSSGKAFRQLVVAIYDDEREKKLYKFIDYSLAGHKYCLMEVFEAGDDEVAPIKPDHVRNLCLHVLVHRDEDSGRKTFSLERN